MRENLVITWLCVRLFPSTTTTLTPKTEKELERMKDKTKKKRKGTKFTAEEKNIEKFKAVMRKWQMLAARAQLFERRLKIDADQNQKR